MEDRFPAQYSVLLTGSPGVGKFEYLISEICEALRLGERVVLVTLDLHPSEIRARAKALRLDLEAHEGKSFVFVDCYSATSSERPEAASGKKTFLVSSFSNLEGIGMAMSKAAQELGTPVRIYFYTISALFLHNSTQAIAKFFQIVTSRVKTNLGFILDRVQDETQVRLHPGRDDLEELRDRLGRVVQEQSGDRVEVDPHGRAELLRRLAHRHPDPLEVREARDEERLFARGRLGSLGRCRAVAVHEHKGLALMRFQVESECFRPRADLARVQVERHEHDALAEAEGLTNLRD